MTIASCSGIRECVYTDTGEYTHTDTYTHNFIVSSFSLYPIHTLLVVSLKCEPSEISYCAACSWLTASPTNHCYQKNLTLKVPGISSVIYIFSFHKHPHRVRSRIKKILLHNIHYVTFFLFGFVISKLCAFHDMADYFNYHKTLLCCS